MHRRSHAPLLHHHVAKSADSAYTNSVQNHAIMSTNHEVGCILFDVMHIRRGVQRERIQVSSRDAIVRSALFIDRAVFKPSYMEVKCEIASSHCTVTSAIQFSPVCFRKDAFPCVR